MSRSFQVFFVFTLAACVSSGPIEFRPQGQASNTRAVLNCELKNGPTGCTDMRIQAVDAYLAAVESDYEETPIRGLRQMEGLLEKSDLLIAKSEGKPYEPPGGRPFKPFNDITMTQVAPIPSTTTTSAPASASPQPGTWYCDNLTGSGNYGTWEMTQHPEQFDVSSCKRVN